MKKGARTENFYIGELPKEETICKNCFESLEFYRSLDYPFLCDDCASCIMKRNDEWDVNNYLDTDLE